MKKTHLFILAVLFTLTLVNSSLFARPVWKGKGNIQGGTFIYYCDRTNENECIINYPY